MVTVESGDYVWRSMPASRSAMLLAMETEGGTFHRVQMPRIYTGLSDDTASNSQRVGHRPSVKL